MELDRKPGPVPAVELPGFEDPVENITRAHFVARVRQGRGRFESLDRLLQVLEWSVREKLNQLSRGFEFVREASLRLREV